MSEIEAETFDLWMLEVIAYNICKLFAEKDKEACPPCLYRSLLIWSRKYLVVVSKF